MGAGNNFSEKEKGEIEAYTYARLPQWKIEKQLEMIRKLYITTKCVSIPKKLQPALVRSEHLLIWWSEIWLGKQDLAIPMYFIAQKSLEKISH